MQTGTNLCRSCGERKEMYQDESICLDCRTNGPPLTASLRVLQVENRLDAQMLLIKDLQALTLSLQHRLDDQLLLIDWLKFRYNSLSNGREAMAVQPLKAGQLTTASPTTEGPLAADGNTCWERTGKWEAGSTLAPTQPSSPSDQPDTPSGPAEPISPCVHLNKLDMGVAWRTWWCKDCGALMLQDQMRVPVAAQIPSTLASPESRPSAPAEGSVMSKLLWLLRIHFGSGTIVQFPDGDAWIVE